MYLKGMEYAVLALNWAWMPFGQAEFGPSLGKNIFMQLCGFTGEGA